MNKDRDYDSFDESDEFAEHGLELADDAAMMDEAGRRHRNRRSNLSSRRRIDDFQEARWLRSHLADWDDWDDGRSAL